MFEEDHLAAWLASREHREIARAEQVASAVLVPLFRRAGAWHVLLLERGRNLSNHAGQIGFPGGRIDPDDASPLSAALREAQEEIGLCPADVRVLGRLDDAETLGGFHMVPFVGAFTWPYPLHAAPAEVESLIDVPLAYFRDPGRLAIKSLKLPDGREREVYFFDVDRGPERVWGATARILKTWLDQWPTDQI